MISLRKPYSHEFAVYQHLEQAFYLHHRAYHTFLQDVDPRKRSLKREFLEIIQDKNTFFRFLEVDFQVVGYIYALIKKVNENEKGWKKIADLNSLVVLEPFRKKGYATFMIQEFFSWLHSKDITYVIVSSNIKNKTSISLFKKLGFQEQYLTFGKML